MNPILKVIEEGRESLRKTGEGSVRFTATREEQEVWYKEQAIKFLEATRTEILHRIWNKRVDECDEEQDFSLLQYNRGVERCHNTVSSLLTSTINQIKEK